MRQMGASTREVTLQRLERCVYGRKFQMKFKVKGRANNVTSLDCSCQWWKSGWPSSALHNGATRVHKSPCLLYFLHRDLICPHFSRC